MARKLDPKHRLQTYSTEEIVSRWEVAATGLCQGRKLGGRKLKPGPLLSALALWFLAQGRERMDAIAAEAVGMLESHLEGRGD